MFPSLKCLSISGMYNLERWSPQEADDDDDDQVVFRSLHTLNIDLCPNLIYLPPLHLPAHEVLNMWVVGCDKMELFIS